LFLDAADFRLFGLDLVEQVQRRLTGRVDGCLLAQFVQIAAVLG
jgi:hypothetical protein